LDTKITSGIPSFLSEEKTGTTMFIRKKLLLCSVTEIGFCLKN
jgi:hypothetical protein